MFPFQTWHFVETHVFGGKVFVFLEKSLCIQAWGPVFLVLLLLCITAETNLKTQSFCGAELIFTSQS